MKILMIGFSIFVIASCSNLQKTQDFSKDWEVFSNLEIGKDTPESVKKILGNPTEINNDKTTKAEVWSYRGTKVSIDWVYFKDGLLDGASMIIDDTEMSNISTLLTKFDGRWKVEKEPVTLVDAMPQECYLFDESLGIEIEISSYKKIAEIVHRWNPKTKRPPPRKSITSWNHDHCAWLKDFLKTKGLLAN